MGDAAAAQRENGDTVAAMTGAKRRKVRDRARRRRRRRRTGGAWAPARAAKPRVSREDLSSQQREYVEWHAARREANLRARGKLKDEAEGALVDQAMGGAGDAGGLETDANSRGGEKSFFHGAAEKNYAGESWITPPKDRKRENDHCYAPKRCIHTWSGHAKGVQAIRFFPKHGHLILSAGLDSKAKIWDVHGSGKCMRTYSGHEKALKDITFYERRHAVRDVVLGQEGEALGHRDGRGDQHGDERQESRTASSRTRDDDQQNVLLAGQSDKKILQYDWNAGDVVQEYDQHLGAVNTITFATRAGVSRRRRMTNLCGCGSLGSP